MKTTATTLLLLLGVTILPAFAQTGPTNLEADVDQVTGTVDLSWGMPFVPEYDEDFDNGAPGWEYDDNGTWWIEDSHLVGQHQFEYGQWIGAWFTAEAYYEQVVEVEMTRTEGNPGSPMAVFVRSNGLPGDGDGFSGLRVSLMNWQLGGSFWIDRIVDDVVEQITPNIPFDAINSGLGASNVISISVLDHVWQVYINGELAHQWNGSVLSVGYVGVGFSDLEDMVGTVEYDYVAIDNLDIDPDPAPPVVPVGWTSGPMTFIGDRDWQNAITHPRVRMQERMYDAIPRVRPWVEATGILDRDAPGSGSGGLDSITEFRVYRDGNMVSVATNPWYSDDLPDFGSYEYTVTAFYDAGESDAADPVEVTWHDPVNFPVYEEFEAGLPDSWTVEGAIPTLNWHVDSSWLMDTPHAYITSADAGWWGESCVRVASRLITPPVNLDGPDLVELEYDYVFNEYMDEILEVAWSADGITWHPIELYQSESEGVDVVHDVTAAVSGEDVVWFSFFYDDQDNWGYEAAVDNVSVFVDGGVPGPASFNLVPTVDTVPAGGGDVVYDAMLQTFVDQAFTGVSYWVEVILPNNQTVGPLNTLTFNLPPYADLTAANATLAVPGFAPAGTYEFQGYVGYPGTPLRINDSFPFSKSGQVGEHSSGPSDWSSALNFVAADAETAVSLPREFALEPGFPNPFNPTTTVAVRLPWAAELDVSVYNIAGQRVAELASGSYPAGRHQFTLDASGLASGLYFVRATVPGQFEQTNKVLLVR